MKAVLRVWSGMGRNIGVEPMSHHFGCALTF